MDQLAQTRTGWSQPRDGTGRRSGEQSPHTPWPQARQWCLDSLAENWRSQLWQDRMSWSGTQATLTKWDVNSSDHDPNSVGDCFPNLPGQGPTFFLLQLGLKQLCIEKIAFLKQRSTKCYSAASHEEEEDRKTIDPVE
ncbi:hypothetical protein EYF80_002495 [Liparis tanakae]|uniref:Uncharacterized protein n=1 Tax=Liparis tanakae TaxID=230148 RepID=A0A4Z2JC06_9TELE|nr:hypothetical protein EYF80_002495 [Liparis tanakae]